LGDGRPAHRVAPGDWNHLGKRTKRIRTHRHLDKGPGVLADSAWGTATCSTTDRGIANLCFRTASFDELLADPKGMVECAAMTYCAILSAHLGVIQPVEAGKTTRAIKADPPVPHAAAESPCVTHPTNQLNAVSLQHWQLIGCSG
jgi:hypothetical protein